MKLTDAVTERLCKAYGRGMTRKLAAAYAGVGHRSVERWLAKGRSGEEPYAAFVAKVEAAEAKGADGMLKVIEDAAKGGTWQAAAWILERRHGYRAKQDVHIETERPTVSRDELRAWLLAKAGTAQGEQ